MSHGLREEQSRMGTEDSGQSQGTAGLSLYGYPSCPFCARVLGAISQLELEIPLRNTMQDSEHRSSLLEAMGRGTVPVLRIDHEDGRVEWLPESVDIVRYLAGNFG